MASSINMRFTRARRKRQTNPCSNQALEFPMKTSLRCLLVLLLAVALMPAKTFSQQVNDKQSDVAARQKAYKLLESLAEQIGSLKSRENRARMGSNVAGSLWAHNEPRAREIFASVIKEIKAGLGFDEKEIEPRHMLAVFLKMRADTALRIGKHDPKWALSFLQESKPEDIKNSRETEAALYLQLATQVAVTHPDLALELGRESVKQGISLPQAWLIYELNKKSRAHASALFAEVVRVALNQNIRSVEKNEEFYFTLATLVEPSLGGDPAFRDLMNYFTQIALTAGCAKEKLTYKDETDYFCYRLGVVVPLMEKVDAKRVAPLKFLARKGGFPYSWSPELTYFADVYENGSIDDLLALFPKFPDDRDFGEWVVIRKLIETGDLTRARKLVGEFRLERSDKQRLLEELDREQRIVNEDTSAEILKEAEAVEDLGDENATFLHLFRVATEIGPRNRQTTIKLLDRATELLEKVPPGRWQTQYQIGIARRYCEVKSDRCFTMMESLVRKMNKLVAAATELYLFDNLYLRNGEWNMTAEGGVGSLLTGMAQNAVYFALYDFDRAVVLAEQFERREIRMMAQLKLAQGLLDGPPKKTLFPKDEQ
jgi:hypothetical protein